MASTFSSLSNWNNPLRIHRRGNFFSDEGFQDYRRHFESAARDLLQEFDMGHSEDTFKSYRRLRDRQLTGTDRAAKIAEESDKYKIVMDVEGFSEGDLEVKVSGPNEIVVEGRQEVSNGGGFVSQRCFRRRFSLPGLALVQDASSVLSSDNVLTVHIPKKIQEITDKQQQTTSLKQEQSSKIDNVQSQIDESFQKAQDSISSAFKHDLRSDTSGSTAYPGLGASLCDLPIVSRQSFFDDSFFENVRHNFRKSVDDMMETRRRRLSSMEDDAVFKKVRETKVENAQATSVTEDAKEHKIVVDVSGFSESDLKVRAVSEHELVVEGKVEKKTSCTSCSSTFRRKFGLPSSVDIRRATSALSSDGILTITVPKRLEAIDYTIPVVPEASTQVSKDAASRISNVIQKELQKEASKSSQDHSDSTRSSCTSEETASSRVMETKSTLNNLNKDTVKKEHVVPIDLEEQRNVETKHGAEDHQRKSETSDVLKESQRLVEETHKLLHDIDTEKQTPVEVKPLSTDHIQKTEQQLRTSQNVLSDTSDSKSFHDHLRTGRIVPISLKGSVYSDSVFDEARRSIEKNVDDVFSKYRQTSEVKEQPKVSDVQKTSQEITSLFKNGQTTSTIQEDVHTYKIVVDVFGFEEKELNVTVSGVNEISIGGNSEKCTNGSVAKHSFQRTFQLPEFVDLERTSTALSEEGILTVTVPKKNQLIVKNEGVTPVSSKIKKELDKKTFVIDSSGIVQESKSGSSIASDFSDCMSQASIKTTSTTKDHVSAAAPVVSLASPTESTDHPREYILPVSVEEASDVASEAGSVYSASNLTSQMSTVSDTSHDAPQSILSTSTSASSIDTQIHSSSQGTDKTSGKVINIGVDSSTPTLPITTKLDDTTRDIVTTRSLFNLPIMSRGHFFDDSFFHDSRSMFESILRNKMNRFNRSSSFVDDLGFFKSLRDSRITGGNQMANLSEDDLFKKIVLDVQGFDESNLKVKVLSENDLLIEGQVEEKSGNSVSKKTFRKQFKLPGSVDLRGATSALSSDGVLNIKIPKSF